MHAHTHTHVYIQHGLVYYEFTFADIAVSSENYLPLLSVEVSVPFLTLDLIDSFTNLQKASIFLL